MKKVRNICQFKITLKGITPPIWRVIQVPKNYTFWGLHIAIQDVMPWRDYHLHCFKMKNPSNGKTSEIGIPPEDPPYEKVYSGWAHKIYKWFTLDNRIAEYTYDFGNNWKHTVELENILPRDENLDYPRCIYGERACPPEDCGSTHGYKDLCKILKEPSHEEYEQLIQWLGKKYNPEHFEIDEVHFDNPTERFNKAFEIAE